MRNPISNPAPDPVHLCARGLVARQLYNAGQRRSLGSGRHVKRTGREECPFVE